MPLHTVLGATGAAGAAVVAELAARDLPFRVVERTKDFTGRETVKADLRDPEQAMVAIQGSSHVYLCVGMPYDTSVWVRDWPMLMSSVIDACRAEGAVLVFLDNMYMYGPTPLATPFDESHDQRPLSRKGRLRQQIAAELVQSFASGSLRGVIGRSADFYGPKSRNSVLYISVIERVLNGKSPQSLFTISVPHTYSYVSDVGRALVELALDESCYGQVWHLPVGNPITLGEIVQLVNTMLGTSYRTSIIPGPIRKLLSLFVRPVKELEEMLYQFTEPYVMSDRKFRDKFPGFAVTSNEQGIRQTLEYFRTQP
jgi:nucleoside-diphosphate-sugar epimerase